MQRLLITVFCLFLAACGGGGGGGGGGDTTSTSSTTPITPTTPTTPTAPTVTASVADYAGRYSGTIDYNLAQIPKKSGVPMQADVTVDGKLTNVIIDGTTTDATASTMLAASETNNNGVIQGSASYSVQNVPGTVYVNYTGRIDVVSGAVSITYNMSGGLTGTIIVNGMRVSPVAVTTGSNTYIVAGSNGVFSNVLLKGGQSTPIGFSALSYEWKFISKPENSNAVLVNANKADAYFKPDIAGSYVVELTVSTSKYNIDKKSITVIANPFTVPDVQLNQSVFIGEAATLEVRNPDPQLSYGWAISEYGSSSITSTLYGTKTNFIPNKYKKYIVELLIYSTSGKISSTTGTIDVKAKYIDNGNGTVTDTYTNLTWPKTDYGALYSWNDASSACRNLRLGGFSNWRLPTDTEARTLTRDPIFTFDDDSSFWAYSPASGYSLLVGAYLFNFNDGYYVSLQGLPDRARLHGVICVR